MPTPDSPARKTIFGLPAGRVGERLLELGELLPAADEAAADNALSHSPSIATGGGEGRLWPRPAATGAIAPGLPASEAIAKRAGPALTDRTPEPVMIGAARELSIVVLGQK